MEWTVLYKNAAATANAEGFPLIAECFTEIAKVEKQHELRYRKLLENIKKGKVFKKDKIVKCGAETAAIFMKEQKRLKDVRHACILNHIMK